MAAPIPARMADHPTVRTVLARERQSPGVIDADWLRGLCLAAGVDDVAFARVDNPDLASEREHVQAALPGAQSYISLVVKMNRDNVRSTARSVANQEFHRSGERSNEAAHRITRVLEDAGYRALSPSASFPMEMDNFPGRIWVVAHKPVAVAAGLGVMGIHRNVIHPKFGNFILLATIIVAAPITSYGEPLDYSPCLQCKLCVAACPVGAIKKNGDFDFLACSTHNYREFMGGFTDWTTIAVESVLNSLNFSPMCIIDLNAGASLGVIGTECCVATSSREGESTPRATAMNSQPRVIGNDRMRMSRGITGRRGLRRGLLIRISPSSR
ncbi:epoxyqueuosine reductase [Mycobacterium avium]|uniref:epoxyqueuosine reductase n=1 Tax=Mycobacterium avium TaxID=1764 RepID=UPI00211C6DA4|nr:4Fe-4S binding protein [Mycobacterium avium]